MANRSAECTTVHGWQRGTTVVAGGENNPCLSCTLVGVTHLVPVGPNYIFLASRVPKGKHHWAITHWKHYLHQSDEQQLLQMRYGTISTSQCPLELIQLKLPARILKHFVFRLVYPKSADSRGFGIEHFFPLLCLIVNAVVFIYTRVDVVRKEPEIGWAQEKIGPSAIIYNPELLTDACLSPDDKYLLLHTREPQSTPSTTHHLYTIYADMIHTEGATYTRI